MSLLISESTIPETGRIAGHFIENKYEDINYMKMSIISAFNFNLFGITSIGVDVCGFVENDMEKYDDLCAWWY